MITNNINPSHLHYTFKEDMLDLAFGLTESSRLGCCVIVTPDMEGMVVKLPSATRNMYVDGHKPVPH